MGLFKRLFKKEKTIRPIPPMLPWDTIVEMLYDKQLGCIGKEVVNVIYSKDNSMRYVVLKDERGIFSYEFEVIRQFDEEEWEYISAIEDAFPAMWESNVENCGISLFACEDDLMKEVKSRPEYKRYFESACVRTNHSTEEMKQCIASALPNDATLAEFDYNADCFGNILARIEKRGDIHTFVLDRGEIFHNNVMLCDSAYHRKGKDDAFPKFLEIISDVVNR